MFGIIYQMPDQWSNKQSIEHYLQRKKICCFFRDRKLDLIKLEEHGPIPAFLDILYSNYVHPLIPKPTRVTANSATWTDYVLVNNFDAQCKHKQGISCNNITDHYAVFYTTNNSGAIAEQSNCTLKRDYRYNDILKCKESLADIQWDIILNEQDEHIAYNEFCNMLTLEYGRCFPIRKYIKALWLR